MNKSRLNRIIENMKKESIDQLIISAPNSLYYLLDKMFHPGERMLALYIHKSGEHFLIVNDLFPSAKALDIEVIFYNDTDDPVEILKNRIDVNGNFGTDKEWPAHFLVKLMKKLPSLSIEIGSVAVDAARMLKDQDEAEKMRKASKINDQTMEKVVAILREQKYTEAEVQKMIPEFFAEAETFEVSFTPSVCYGEHAAVPHHNPGDRRPETGHAIIIDMGGRTNGYCSDMTRSFFYGEPPEEYLEIYELVRQANLAGIAAVKPGVKLKDVDLAARKVIEAGGYGDYFTHRTGHGIGIEVHEFPDVSSINEMVLEVGMCFSVEPGIYLEGKYGVRIEDIVIVTENGCEVLNHYSKDLKIL